jgi:hypothetical protein
MDRSDVDAVEGVEATGLAKAASGATLVTVYF